MTSEQLAYEHAKSVGWNEAVKACAKVAENYSNAKPGDICEVMAGDWQAEIAKAIRALDRSMPATDD